MKLGFEETQSSYTSGAQNARLWTERWVRDWVFCFNCGANKVQQYPANKPVADFFCEVCNEEYELKSQKNKFGKKVVDGAFSSMCARLQSLNNPNLLLLNYDVTKHTVTNLLVVPKHLFVKNIIEERKPLAHTARRAGWVGCNILLDKIPSFGKIFVIKNGKILPKETVRHQWQQTLFLREKSTETRGWLLEVMGCIERNGKNEFSLDEIYQFEVDLSKLYPRNRYVKEKIRQQLQVLREKGILEFSSRGLYRLKAEM